MTTNKCVTCGAEIPEGRQVCIACERQVILDHCGSHKCYAHWESKRSVCPVGKNEYCRAHNSTDAPDDIINQWYDLLSAPVIKDSGERRQFESGAVRDIQEGKGRCDLLPLDVVARQVDFGAEGPNDVLLCIYKFTYFADPFYLHHAVHSFCIERGWNVPTMLLEVAIHFSDGCKKYGENNWQKGIPVRCYLDSGVRHYLKWRRGDKDEPHDRAVCWNLMCAIWTCIHLPELNDYRKPEDHSDE